MKILIICLILFCTNLGFAQDYPSFYAKVPLLHNTPVVTHDFKGNRINSSNTGDSRLDFLINSYEIYSVERVFKNSKKSSLQNMYMIVCNDMQLMHNLKKNFSNYFPELIEIYSETLVFPNDFGTTGGYTNVDQEELNYIRAPEAWDISTGSENVIIGVSDNSINPMHEDFENKVTQVGGNNAPNLITGSHQHGSWVSSFAAANTDNGLGLSATGYNSSIYHYRGRTNGVDILSQIEGVKVINTAWISSSSTYLQDSYNEIVEDRGVVVVGSAGNGAAIHGSSESLIYPAAFRNVISVTGIGHQNEVFGGREIFLDYHEFKRNGEWVSTQHNDSVDIAAPAMGLSFVDPRGGLTGYGDNGSGTSFSSPIVSGTIALMFDQNYCLDPKEVETILKLTAVRIDHLPQNLPYFGKLGAGKLDAYEAVKMAKDMADPLGTVEVKDRILYRPWFYKLVTAPYEIKMTNNDVTGESKLKFIARNNIEILSGDYSPQPGGYISLNIDNGLALDCNIPQTTTNKFNAKPQSNEIRDKRVLLHPNPAKDEIRIEFLKQSENITSVELYNIQGVLITKYDNLKQHKINISNLKTGIYHLKITTKNNTTYTKKIIKI